MNSIHTPRKRTLRGVESARFRAGGRAKLEPVKVGRLRSLWDERKDRDMIAVSCSATCTSFRVVPRRCEGGHWHKLPPIEPTCACTPESVPSSLRECKVRTIELRPTDEGASDGVSLELTCGKTLIDAGCDDENDGTGTSLCDCHRGGKDVHLSGDPWKGAGISLAYQVAERCLAK